MPKIFDELKEKNPGKYPSRIGKPWSDEEVNQLLQEIKKKIPIELIAEYHERTEGGIISRLRSIAADYYFNNNLSLQEIQKYTGLSTDVISDAIAKREYQNQLKEKKKEKSEKLLIQDSPVFQELAKEEKESDTKEIISLLKDIKGLLKAFLDNIHYES